MWVLGALEPLSHQTLRCLRVCQAPTPLTGGRCESTSASLTCTPPLMSEAQQHGFSLGIEAPVTRITNLTGDSCIWHRCKKHPNLNPQLRKLVTREFKLVVCCSLARADSKCAKATCRLHHIFEVLLGAYRKDWCRRWFLSLRLSRLGTPCRHRSLQ